MVCCQTISVALCKIESPDLLNAMVAQWVKNLLSRQEMQVWSLGWEGPLEKEMAIHSIILAWRIPWTEETGGLQSIALQRVGHDWSDSALVHSLNACVHHPPKFMYWNSNAQFDDVRRWSLWEVIRSSWRGLEIPLSSLSPSTMKKSESEVTQSCPTLCNPVGYSPSGSSVHGVLQARILEWVAISFHHMRIQRELCNLEEDLHLTTQAPDLRYQPPELWEINFSFW